MKWAINHYDEGINLDNICHMWMTQTEQGYWIEGEMMHNRQEISLSIIFKTEKECLEVFKRYLSQK